jgi:hypothetical protein
MHTLVADVHPGASDNFLYFLLAFTTKRAANAIFLFSVLIIAFKIKQEYSSLYPYKRLYRRGEHAPGRGIPSWKHRRSSFRKHLAQEKNPAIG